jgi:hypothetical protein
MTLDQLIGLVEDGDAEVVRAALRAQPDLALERAENGDTLLHFACGQKHAAIVEVVLSAHPDVNAAGENGRTPLHAAVYEGGAESLELVRLLMARGANPALEDANGFSVAALAEDEMTSDLDEVLELLGAPPAPGPRPLPAASPPVVRRLESKGHTSVALARLMESFVAREPLSTKAATRGLAGADEAVIADAARVLRTLESSVWVGPVREWAREKLKDAELIALVDRLYDRR